MEKTVYNNNSEIELEVTKVSWWAILLEGIIAILAGLFLLVRPATTTVLLIQILGIYWLASGILSVLGAIIYKEENRAWKLIAGILSILAGIFILTYPYYGSFVLLKIFIIFIGIWAIISGGIKLYSALRRGGWGMGILGIITIILGLLLLTNFLIGILVLPWIFGFFLVIGGIAALIIGIKKKY